MGFPNTLVTKTKKILSIPIPYTLPGSCSLRKGKPRATEESHCQQVRVLTSQDAVPQYLSKVSRTEQKRVSQSNQEFRS